MCFAHCVLHIGSSIKVRVPGVFCTLCFAHCVLHIGSSINERCSRIWKPLGGKLGGSSYPPGVANTLRSESVNHNNGLDVLKRKLLNTNSGGSSAQRCLEGGAVALRPRWWVFSKGDKNIAKVHYCRCPRKRILVNNKYLGSHALQTFGPSMIHVRCCRCCCCATVLLDKSAATDGSTATTDY